MTDPKMQTRRWERKIRKSLPNALVYEIGLSIKQDQLKEVRVKIRINSNL
jgi:hypothetical protein